MTKHTPGPWIVKEENDGEVWVLRPDKKSGLCRMLPPRGQFTHGKTLEKINLSMENLANARLIASSPDLLEACEMMIAKIDTGAWDCLPTNKMRAAIFNTREQNSD